MSFDAPHWLWGLLLIPILIGLFIRAEHRGLRRLQEFVSARLLPQLAGKLTGNAVRVPTPDVSLAILNLTLKKETTKEDVNEILRRAALHGDLVEQIQYSISNELVSSDLVGNSCAAILDSPATIVSKDNKSVVLYVWYDNEYGYSRQVIRYAKYLADVIRLRYY